MDYEFKSDGCSWFLDGTWGPCCVEHDKAYHRGGAAMKRFVADLELAKCVAGNLIERGCPAFFAFVLGTAMFLGVRIGGMPIFPAKKFRWGYGWKYTKSVTYKQQEKLSP